MKTWLRRDGLVLLIYIFLAPILTYPLVAHFDSHVPGQPIDAPALAWNLWWFKFAIFNLGASPLTTDYLYYPLGVNMVANTSTFLNGLIALPLTFVFGTIIAQNLIVWFALVIGGYGTFLLAREILARQNIRSDFACALAGAFYAFGAWHINYVSAGHFMLLSNEWIPFFALYLIRFERARWRNGMFAGLFFVMTAWTELTFIPFVAVLSALYLIFQIGRGFTQMYADKKISAFVRVYLRPITLNVGILGMIAALGIAPQLVSLLADTLRYGYYIAPGQGRAAIFSAEPISYFVPSAAHPIVGAMANALTNANTSYAFIGLAALAFAILGFVCFRKSSEIIFWSATALFFALVLLGPTLIVGEQNTNIPMPFAILRALPFVNANRYPVRYNAMMMLALTPLIALGVARLQKSPRVILGALVALFAFEQLAFPVVLTDLRAPALVQTMRAEPGDFTVMDLPLGWRDSVAILGKIDYVAQFLQTYHEKRLIGGLVSRHPDFKYQYYLEQPILNSLIALENGRAIDDAQRARDRELAPDVLRFFKVRYVIATRAMTDASVLDYAREVFPLEEIYRDDTRIIFRVTNSPAKLERINQDDEAARLYFDDAWGRVQFSPEGLAYRWSARDEATLWLPIEPGTPSVTVRLRAAFDQQMMRVRMNGQLVAEISLSSAWANYTIPIRASILREGANEFVFQTEPRALHLVTQDSRAIGDTGVNSPVDISVTGAGFDAGRFGAIWVAGKNVIESKRGYHLVAINAQTGVVERISVFDTFADKDASARLAQFIADLPNRTIVAGVAIDDVSKNLQANAIAALRSIGVESDLRLQFRAGHAFIGVKGAQVGQALDSVDGRLPANVSAGKNVASDRVGFAIAEIKFDE